MNYEKLGKNIVEQLLMENFTDKVSLYPGAFKPPHKGHVQIALDSFDSDTSKLILFVSSKSREDVEVEESLKAWELYKENTPGLENMEIISTPTPVKAVYDYVKDNPTHDIKAVFGKGEEDRFTSLATKYPNVEIFNAGTIGNYSATDLRKAIRDKDKEAIATFLPSGVNIDSFLSIFQIQEKLNEIGDLSQKPYDWKAEFDKSDEENDVYSFITDSGTKYEVNLYNSVGTRSVWDLEFLAQHGIRGMSSKQLTGGNEPLKIMSTIVDIVKSFIEYKGDVDSILYSPTKGKTGEEDAKDNTRAKLYKIIIQKNFPKAKISGTDDIEVDVSAYKGEDMFETIVGDEIHCDNCDWHWKIKEGGDDLYTCHKCWHDNTPITEETLFEEEDRLMVEVVNPDGERFKYEESNIKGLYTYKDSKDNLYFARITYSPSSPPRFEFKVGWFEDNNISKPKYEPYLPSNVTGMDNLQRRNTVAKIYRDEILPFFKKNQNIAKQLDINPISNSRYIFSQRLVQNHTPENYNIDLRDGKIIVTVKTNENSYLQEARYNKFLKESNILNLDIPKFNYKKTLTESLWNTINEISLSKDNAVEINGDLTGGYFKVGNITYTYSIKNIPNPYRDLGLFYNIQFTPEENTTSIPQGGKENYIKILSTMYKIITDFIEKEKPEYIGISSLNNDESKNYHKIYANLTDNRFNNIPGYFRKDVSLEFNTPEGKGRFIVLKRKKGLNENKYLQEARYNKFLKESWEPNKARVINQFMDYCSDYLSIDKPTIKLINAPEYTQQYHSFGGYMPSEQKIMVVVHNRNMADILRTLAHEMVHHMQNQDDRLDPKSGEDGSPEENEANSLAGVIMRQFGRNNPHIYE